MKLCFLVNNAPGMADIFLLVSRVAVANGCEVCVISNSYLTDIKYQNKFYGCRYYSTLADYPNFTALEIPPNAWKMLYPSIDRKTIHKKCIRFDYDTAISIIKRLYSALSYILSEEKPDAVIYEPPSNVFSQIAYDVCRRLGIRYLGITPSRLPNRTDIYDHLYSTRLMNSPKVEVTEYDRHEIEGIMHGLINHTLLPSYVAEANTAANLVGYYLNRFREEALPRIKWMLLPKTVRRRDYEAQFILRDYANNVFNRIKTAIPFIRDPLKRNVLPSDGPYYLIPLHVQPEASTSAQASFFCNLYEFVRNCSICVPFPSKVLVKEHPAFMKLRPRSFYEALSDLPNVLLVSAKVDNKFLIQNSLGVITITSTVGFEALLQCKPVYVFGEVFYATHPKVKMIKSWDQLERILKEDMHNFSRQDLNEWKEENIRFIKKYLECSYPGNFVYTDMRTHTMENAGLLFEAIMKHLKALSEKS